MLVAKQVTHPNVLAIEGVLMTDDSKLSIVSPWMEHGNMHEYLKGNEVVDCVELVSTRPYLCHSITYTGTVTRRGKGPYVLTFH